LKRSQTQIRKKLQKISVAAYHLSTKFDLLDKSVAAKRAAFVCTAHSEKPPKELKGRKNKGLTQSLC